jgi:thiol-disulfide isomerase/thioredoxin
MVSGNFSLKLLTASILFVVMFVSCGRSGTDSNLSGNWRFVLEAQGNELPFIVEITESESGTIEAAVRNGVESLPFSSIIKEDTKITMTFDHYDSYLEGVIEPGGKSIAGKWSRRAMKESRTVMDFSAMKDESNRFMPVTASADPYIDDISGEWSVRFGNGDSPSIGIFEQKGKMLTGTFLTTTGDYRFLEGTFEGNNLRMSVFDGAHAFLFHASVDKNGKMTGDFWSRDTHHSNWTAVKEKTEMPDPYTLTKLTNMNKKFSFDFPDVNGNMVSDKDDRFKGKPYVVCIFGTWCPNCNDEAPFLVELYNEYHSRGLEIIGLSNEFADDFEKDSDIVKRFAKKYEITWPILVVGIADKKKTAEALSDLDRVLSYPTTIFIDKNGNVQKIHTGFMGPGTGKYYDKLQKEFRQTIETMLN